MALGSRPTILLNHGAYHRSSVWERLVPLLEKSGYRCIAPQLPYCGTETPIQSWKECIDQIRQLLEEEIAKGRGVVLVNHSLAGVPGCSAVKELTTRLTPTHGRVIGIVQVTAMNFVDGDQLEAFYDALPKGSQRRENGWKFPPATAKDIFYNDLEPSDAEYWSGLLIPNSDYLHKSHEAIYAGFKDVPVWYIKCTNDLAIVPAEQDMYIGIIRSVNKGVKVREIEAGHSPFLSKPEETVALIDEAVQGFLASGA